MKAPKKPKQSASLETWKKYEANKKAFDKAKAEKAAIIKRASK